MAVRGILSGVLIYPEVAPAGTLPVYSFQNYFPNPTNINGIVYDYRACSISSILLDKNSVGQAFSITFPGTVQNIDLVEASLTNRYTYVSQFVTWSAVEGLENPSSFNLLGFGAGTASSAESDFSTVTVDVQPYSNAVNADLPWRKIPWTILGPLSLRE
jgi:hypothetical protein